MKLQFMNGLSIIISHLIISLYSCGQCKQKDFLTLGCDSNYEKCGYLNSNGDTVIKFGKYYTCYTDTFKTFAIVLKPGYGFVGIDRNEKILFQVFSFDNNPDFPKEGLFRIVDSNNKIGYANTKGEIVIQPKYECALPFENGKAKVAFVCQNFKEKDGEHSGWISDKWFYINASGKKE